MRWIKLNITDDHDLGLSTFELPWMAAVPDSAPPGKDTWSLLIKYLGSEGRLCEWKSMDRRAKVLYQRDPLKVVFLEMSPSPCANERDDAVQVLRQFLRGQFADRPEDASKYLEILKDVFDKSCATTSHTGAS